jgi:tripartite-type tricarboxylate transporter receptor subunit TctC
VAKKGFSASNLSELLAQAKADPGKITYGSAGVGSISHFGNDLLR